MLRISKLADYGMTIMTGLALAPGAFLSAGEVAVRVHLSRATVSKVLKLLLKSGLVRSSRGTGGGYSLARPAEQISVAEVITAVDGVPAMTECAAAQGLCHQDAVCALKGNWQIINRVVTGALEKLSLADMSRPLTEL